jgi:O-antigen/teichoic acid export membrane protein
VAALALAWPSACGKQRQTARLQLRVVTDVRVEDAHLEERRDDYAARRLGITALASDAVVYGGTRALLKSLSFLLVPLYAHFVAPAEFGRLAIVLALVAIVDVLITAGMDSVFARFYFDRDEEGWRRRVITLYLVIESVYPAFVVFPLVAFSASLSDRVFGVETYAAFFVIALVDVYLTNIVDLPMNLTRLRRRRKRFVAYSLTRGLTQILFTVLLVAVWHLNVKGILIASLVAVSVAAVITLREYVFDLTRRVDWRVCLEMIHFAWPGIIGGVAFYALGYFDRFFVRHYHGDADTGLYEIAFRYAQVVVVAVLAFRMGWAPWHYPWLRSGRHPSMVARGAVYFFFATGFLVVLVSAWILPVFHLLMPDRYFDATPAVAPLALAGLASGAYTVFHVGLNVTKRMRLLPPLACAGGAIATGLYFLLIPPFSFVGAAWATVAAVSCLALLVLAVSNRIYPVPWDWRRIGLAVFLAAGAALLSLGIDSWLSVPVSIPARVAITLGYPLLLYALGFFPRGDLAAARSRFRKVLRLA